MHGATYTVDAEFKTDALVEKSNWVVDIGAASEMLSDVLSKYNFKNLNELFPGENTTTEFMCKASRPPLWAAHDSSGDSSSGDSKQQRSKQQR